MANLTAQQVADKWVRNTSAATQYLQQGVMGVRNNPADAAIAAKTKMVSRWNDAVNGGKWEASMRRQTLQSWQNAMINKGLPRISAGVTAAQGKFQSFMADLIPFQAQLKQQIDAMPNMTLQDSIQRQIAWTTGMAAFKRQG